MKHLQELLAIIEASPVDEAGRTFTIKNDNIKPRGAPEVKARAFDKVNPKTGARPNRSVLKKMQKDAEDFFAIQGEEGDEFTMCLVMSAANSEKSNYYGVNVLLYPDGKTEASTADSFADKEWKNHRGRIVKVAREFLKKDNAFSRDGLDESAPSSVEMHKHTLFIERLAEYFDLDEETFKPLSTKDLRVMYNKLLLAGLIKRINLDR